MKNNDLKYLFRYTDATTGRKVQILFTTSNTLFITHIGVMTFLLDTYPVLEEIAGFECEALNLSEAEYSHIVDGGFKNIDAILTTVEVRTPYKQGFFSQKELSDRVQPRKTKYFSYLIEVSGL